MNATDARNVLDRLANRWPTMNADPLMWSNVVLAHEELHDVLDAVELLELSDHPPRPADLREALRQLRRRHQPVPIDRAIWRRGLAEARKALDHAS